MKSYNELITAGTALNLPIAGRTLYIKESSAGEVLNVEFTRRGAESDKIEFVGKGFKATPSASFSGIKIVASVNSQVQFIVTDGDIDIAFNTDNVIVGNGDASPVPVRTIVDSPLLMKTGAGDTVEVRTNPAAPLDVLFAGTVAPVLGVVTVDNTDAEAIPVMQKTGTVFSVEQASEVDTRPYQAVTVTDLAQVAVTDVLGVLIAVGATRRGLRIKNAGANPVAIGGATLAFAAAAALIQPGETWNENEAPGAAWYCVCGAALASTLNIQDII